MAQKIPDTVIKYPMTTRGLYEKLGRPYRVAKTQNDAVADKSSLTCPKCGAECELARTTTRDEKTNKLVAWVYLRCTVSDDVTHGWGFKSDSYKAELLLQGGNMIVEEVKNDPAENAKGKNKVAKGEDPEQKIDKIDMNDPAALMKALIESLAQAKGKQGEKQEPEKPKEIVYKMQDVKGQDLGEVKDAHKQLDKLLKLYAAGVRLFLLVGPAGSGKTTLCSHFAKALKRDLFVTSCSEDMVQSRLVGRVNPDNSYLTTPLVDAVNSKGVALIDEIDRGNPNALCAIHTIENGFLTTPKGRLDIDPDMPIIATANTFGMGADRVYAGANQLDGATLDRFHVLQVDYDLDLEDKMIPDKALLLKVRDVRAKANQFKIRKPTGIRFSRHCYQDLQAFGGKSTESVKRYMTESGWTPDEMSRVGV